MIKLLLQTCFLAILSITLFSCHSDPDLNLIKEQQIRQDIQTALQQIQTVQGADLNIATRTSAKIIYLDAGSQDALVQALKDAGEGGIVYFRAGLHTETKGIVIGSKVTLIGETGAVLKISAYASVMNLSTGVTDIYAGLHVLNAPQTLISNLEIQPTDSNGSTAILFENTSLGAAINCTIKSFMFSVMVENANQTTIMGNKITGSTLWKFNPGLMAGIINTTGIGTWIAENEIETIFTGVFLSDQKGTVTKNKVRKGRNGVVLCHVVPNSFNLPKGNKVGGEFSTSNWKVTDNELTDNTGFGFLIVDGSYNNTLEGNTISGTGSYDIYLTKAGTKNSPNKASEVTHDNIVKASATQKVKDCGRNNTVTGVTLVDTAVDPCD